MTQVHTGQSRSRHRPVPTTNALITLDEEISQVLRDPPIAPAAVYPGRHRGRADVHAVHAPSVTPYGEEPELALLDFVTSESTIHPPTRDSLSWNSEPVLSRERSRARTLNPARGPRRGDAALIMVGVAVVGAMLGLLVVLASGYGAT